jgi:hypothetical protein
MSGKLLQCPPIYEMVQDDRKAIRQADYHRFLRWLRYLRFLIQNSRFIHMPGACAVICRQ